MILANLYLSFITALSFIRVPSNSKPMEVVTFCQACKDKFCISFTQLSFLLPFLYNMLGTAMKTQTLTLIIILCSKLQILLRFLPYLFCLLVFQYQRTLILPDVDGSRRYSRKGGGLNNDNMYGPDSLEKNIYSNSITLLEN